MLFVLGWLYVDSHFLRSGPIGRNPSQPQRQRNAMLRCFPDECWGVDGVLPLTGRRDTQFIEVWLVIDSITSRACVTLGLVMQFSHPMAIATPRSRSGP